MKQTILVTGGTGFIGSHTTVELQEAGYDVVIVDNLSNSKADVVDGIEKITGIRPAFEQVDCQVRQFAKERGITADEARRMVSDYRKKFAAEHNGSKVSLGNTLLAFGVPIEQSVEWRRSLLEPADFLGRDEPLIETLKILQSKYKLICNTNNIIFMGISFKYSLLKNVFSIICSDNILSQ